MVGLKISIILVRFALTQISDILPNPKNMKMKNINLNAKLTYIEDLLPFNSETDLSDLRRNNPLPLNNQ